MTKFETALQREFSERLKSINLNFIHTTNYTWGKTVIIPYTQNGEHKQLREDLNNYSVETQVSANDTAEDIAERLIARILGIEVEAYAKGVRDALDKWSQDYNAEDIKGAVQCQELLGWRFLPLESDGFIKNGRVVAVHYATYLPNLGLLDEKNKAKDEKPKIGGMLDLIVEFDEMGFAPTTVCPNPEDYAGAFRNRIINCNEEEIKQAQIDILNRLKGKLEDYEDHCLEMHDWQGQTAINECEKYIDEIIKEIRER